MLSLVGGYALGWMVEWCGGKGKEPGHAHSTKTRLLARQEWTRGQQQNSHSRPHSSSRSSCSISAMCPIFSHAGFGFSFFHL